MDKGVWQLPDPLFWHAHCAPDHKPRAHEISESDEVRSLIELRNERFEGISEPPAGTHNRLKWLLLWWDNCPSTIVPTSPCLIHGPG